MPDVLISLHRGYGMGDAVQMSAVLRHLRKHRPDWVIDFQAEPGRHVVGRGIAHNTLAYGDPYPRDYYDSEAQIVLYDTWAGHGGKPNTRVESCLREVFGLEWDADCGRYQVNVSEATAQAVDSMLSPLMARKERQRAHDRERPPITRKRTVAIHYEGDSAKAQKDLTHGQAGALCRAVERLGRMPVLVDWRHASPLRAEYYSTGQLPAFRAWGGDAEYNTALIAQCEAFVGIDSGPGKCASATDTPALIIWTGHHPAPFHDPAPNTTHLVPVGFHSLAPVRRAPDVVKWFDANYRTRIYDCDPIPPAVRWLQEVLP